VATRGEVSARAEVLWPRASRVVSQPWWARFGPQALLRFCRVPGRCLLSPESQACGVPPPHSPECFCLSWGRGRC